MNAQTKTSIKIIPITKKGMTSYHIFYYDETGYQKLKDDVPLDTIQATTLGVINHRGKGAFIDIELVGGVPTTLIVHD